MYYSEAYLHYIRRQNPIVEGASNAEQVRGTVTKAYEFALNECGNDRESGELWQEYIAFLTDASVSSPPNYRGPLLTAKLAQEYLGDATTNR
jgi:hypothetical protein